MADYDEGELTEREKLAGEKQKSLSKYSDNTLTDVAKYSKNSARNIAKWQNQLQGDIASKNAARTTDTAEYNARSTRDQLNRQLANYNFANKQNASLRDTEFTQASRKSEAERFEAQRNLQNAALGLFGSMNQAMNGSTVGNAMRMLENRNDAENSQYWQTLQDNRNAIQNAYDESYNQNQVAKRDAAVNAIKALNDIQGNLSSDLSNIDLDYYANLGNIRGDLMSNLSNINADLYANRRNLRADTAANLSNINPNLYEEPENLKVPTSGYKAQRKQTGLETAINELTGAPVQGISYDSVYQLPGSNRTIGKLENRIQNRLGNIKANQATLLDYIMPENSGQDVRARRNTLAGNDYFSRLVNGFN